jgi:hypothetical protein
MKDVLKSSVHHSTTSLGPLSFEQTICPLLKRLLFLPPQRLSS